jgi:cell division protein FtsA
MKLNKPYLIVELSDNKIIFFVVSYDENKDYKLIKKTIINSEGIQNGRIANIELVTDLAKKTIHTIEDKTDCLFSQVSIIINPINVNCLNISGFKKLNGSQVSKEDITYILNDIKKTISANEDKYSLIHLFNSSFSLDSDNLENLPIGLFGEFYNQNMTFFLINKNILKNMKLVFGNCGVNIDRIILKPFAEGVNFLLKDEKNKNFTSISIDDARINVSVFKNKSYVLTQDFNFGTDTIMKDIAKLCSLNINEVEFFFREINLKSVLAIDEDSYLDKKFFSSTPYRKIKHHLILNIITARLDELIEICYEKNTNLTYFKKNNNLIYINIVNSEFFKNIQFALEKNKLINQKFIFGRNEEDCSIFTLNGAAELIGKGWDKEAIPVVQTKKSLISAFFSRLFS